MSLDPDVQAAFSDSYQASDPDVQAAFSPTWGDAAKGAANLFKGGAEGLLHAATGAAGALGGGLTYLGTLAATRDPAAAEAVRQDTQNALTYQPRTKEGKESAGSVDKAASYLGPKEGEAAGPAVADFATRAGASPQVAGALGAAANTGIQAIPMLLPGVAKGAFKGAPEAAPRIEPTMDPEETVPLAAKDLPLSASGASRLPSFEPADIPGTQMKVDNEPVEGGLPAGIDKLRADILRRVGLQNARESALTGNAQAAATDYQMTKFDEPAGQAAKAQFDTERQALASHAEGVVRDTGGSIGTDEDSLSARGQTIAAPFDALKDYFEQAKQKAYDAAGQKAQGKPVGTMDGVQNLLKDPDFTETLLAKDQGNLLGSIQRQFQRFQDLNPQGFTVDNAENFRKWLNQVWTPDNSNTIGRVKAALDDDVLKGAGEDIYGPARQTVQLEKQVFGQNGIGKLMDSDPKNPLNRSTPYEKIPDALTRLPVAQYQNLIKTLQTMPDEIQPQAQAAVSEIKAHLANKVADAGSSTQGQWNAPAVSKVLKANSAKFQAAFEDQPQVLQKLQYLDSAGKILKVNQSYPGAAAQAANAMKRGLLSRAITHVAGSAGGAAGSVLGPLGAAGGAALGEAAGSRLGSAVGERAALNRWNARNVRLSDLVGGSQQ